MITKKRFKETHSYVSRYQLYFSKRKRQDDHHREKLKTTIFTQGSLRFLKWLSSEGFSSRSELNLGPGRLQLQTNM